MFGKRDARKDIQLRYRGKMEETQPRGACFRRILPTERRGKESLTVTSKGGSHPKEDVGVNLQINLARSAEPEDHRLKG